MGESRKRFIILERASSHFTVFCKTRGAKVLFVTFLSSPFCWSENEMQFQVTGVLKWEELSDRIIQLWGLDAN